MSVITILFIVVMDSAFGAIPHVAETHMRNVKLKGREAIGTSQGLTKSFRALRYADDTLLCEDSEGAMQALLWAVEDVSGVFGLNLNKGKCQHLNRSRRDHQVQRQDRSQKWR